MTSDSDHFTSAYRAFARVRQEVGEAIAILQDKETIIYREAQDRVLYHLRVLSTFAAVGQDHLRNFAGLPTEEAKPKPLVLSGETCPDCGVPLVHADGCLQCRGCGFTRCE